MLKQSNMSNRKNHMDSKRKSCDYVFKGVRWEQKILTYVEFGRLLDILGKEITGISQERKVFEATIEQWYRSGKLRECFKVWLKLHEPNLWAKLKNRFAAWRNKADIHDPILSMSLDEVAQVNADFFLLNAEWMANLMITQRSLELSEVQMTSRTPLAQPSSSVGSPGAIS